MCMQYAAVHICVCSISICTLGLFTRIAVCKFLHGLAVVWPETFLLLHCLCLYTLYTFPASFVWHFVP